MNIQGGIKVRCRWSIFDNNIARVCHLSTAGLNKRCPDVFSCMMSRTAAISNQTSNVKMCVWSLRLQAVQSKPISIAKPKIQFIMHSSNHRIMLIPIFLLSSLFLQVSTHTVTDLELQLPDLSLPDLSTLSYVNSLSITSWDLTDSASFLEGRIILTPEQDTIGGLLAKNPMELGPLEENGWTLEVVWRAMGEIGRTDGGFAIQLLESADPDANKDALYGGKFNGLNVVIDAESNKANALHAYLNDGSKDLKASADVHSNSFGSCLISYQDSAVPLTLRIAYSAKERFFLVQVDNKICLKTDKIDLSGVKAFNIGLQGRSGPERHERFEVLKLKTYSGIIDEVSSNMDKFASQPEIIKKVVYDASIADDSSAKGQSQSIPVTQLNSLIQSQRRLQVQLSQIQSQLDKLVESQRVDNTPSTSNDIKTDNGGEADELTLKLQQLVTQLSQKLETLKSQSQQSTASSAQTSSTTHGSGHVQSLKNWVICLVLVILGLSGVVLWGVYRLREELKRKLL